MDLRGIGRSDPIPETFTLEERVGDLIAVVDAVGASRVIAAGLLTGGSLALLFAARYPERVSSVIANEGYARYLTAPDYPFGLSPEAHSARLEAVEEWGTGHFSLRGIGGYVAAPVVDPAIVRIAARLERASASPAAARRILELHSTLDIRADLPAINAPILVLSHGGRSDGWLASPTASADLAARLQSPRFATAGPDPAQADIDVARELTKFISGSDEAPEPDRVLSAILVTDIVGSTERASLLGDAMWRALVEEHDRIVTEAVARAGGRVIKFMGDGSIALIPLASRALRCADDIARSLRSSGVQVRAGLHVGEVDLRRDDISGLSVNVAARVAAIGRPGEIYVTESVRTAVVGNGTPFHPAGSHDLKGLPGSWVLHRTEPMAKS